MNQSHILKTFIIAIAVLSFTYGEAQRPQGVPPAQQASQTTSAQARPAARASSAGDVHIPIDTVVRTQHQITVKGQRFSYTANTGMQPVWNDDGKAIATLFYVYYTRDDVKDRSTRPLIISFNGGPGTGSVWMNIGYTGPRRLKISDEGYPVQPFGIEENPYSIIDVADIVFVCPVNTGFSRIVDKTVDKSRFFGVNADINYLSSWIGAFITRNNRWASPKFLIGESYGTTRVSGLANRLQNSEWVYLNGVILVSPTDLGISRSGPAGDALMLPYYAATAWYHKQLPADLQSKDLVDVLPEVESFTVNQYIPALAKGGSISAAERNSIATTVARYSGLKKESVTQNNLVIRPNFFWKDLLRDKGYTVGRLDSRYLGKDQMDAGMGPDYNAELNSWLNSFTPAINDYLRNDLGFKTDLKYYMFGPVQPWNNDFDRTGMQLSASMMSNPALHLMVQSGYYDGACDYFNAKYDMWQINKSGSLNNRMEWHGYRSGHMMYLRKEDLKTSNEDIRNFIKKATPAPGQEIKYPDLK
ncbi:MAG: carboxypeptidase [Chitinophagaceae bacterium]|nr:carboxypeptidase [Chitinophagaceae bacterium]